MPENKQNNVSILWAVIPVVAVVLGLIWSASNPPAQPVSSPLTKETSRPIIKQTPPSAGTKNTVAAQVAQAAPSATVTKAAAITPNKIASSLADAGKKGATGTDSVKALGQKYLAAWRSEKSSPKLRANALKNLGTVYEAASNRAEILAELFKVSKQNGTDNTVYAQAAEESLKQIRARNPAVASKVTFLSKHLIE